MGVKQTGRGTSRTVEFNELWDSLLKIAEASGLSFADVVRMLVREGLKGEFAKIYLGNKKHEEKTDSSTERQALKKRMQ